MKKKLLAALLVAILASSMAFAGLTGSVSTSAGYDFDTNEYGFFGLELKNAELVVKLAGEDVPAKAAEETAEEAKLYASIKASLAINACIQKNTLGSESANVIWYDSYSPKKGFYFDLVVEEAKVGGKVGDYDWYVSILGTPAAPALAKSYQDLDSDGNNDDDYKIGYFSANGVEVGFADYVLGLGLHGIKDKANSFTLSLATPEYALVEGLTVQGAVAYSHRGALDAIDAVAAKGSYWYWDNETNTPVVKYIVDEIPAVEADAHNIGGSVKVAYTNDLISASVASDLGVKSLKKDPKFGMDLAANFAYDFVSVDAYYAFKDTLHAKVTTDFGKLFEAVPVTLSVGVNNIITDSRSLTASVGFEGYGVEASVSGEVALKANPDWEFAVSGAYSIADYAKVKASVSYNSKEWLGASVSVESGSIIPGAKLALGWYDATDLLGKNNGKCFDKTYDGSKDIPETAKLVANHTDKGVIKASCTIEF